MYNIYYTLFHICVYTHKYTYTEDEEDKWRNGNGLKINVC